MKPNVMIIGSILQMYVQNVLQIVPNVKEWQIIALHAMEISYFKDQFAKRTVIVITLRMEKDAKNAILIAWNAMAKV